MTCINPNIANTGDVSSPGVFTLTSWTTVRQARNDDSDGQAALERLLLRYYTPIQRVIQHQQRCTSEQAQELTQEFIKECLRRDFLAKVNPEKGRFRTFIRRCIEYFLRDQHYRSCAEKRGGGEFVLSLHQIGENGQPLLDPPAELDDPGMLMDREWARQVVTGALTRLEQECTAARMGDYFRELRGQLTGTVAPEAGAAIAARLGLKEATVHVARHRLRQRLSELIAEEVRMTVDANGDNKSDWREELQYLIQLLGEK